MTRFSLISISLGATLVAFPAMATPNLPGEACPTTLTIQSKDCTVTHITRCEGDADGVTTSLLFDADGILFSASSDAQGGWLESYDSASNVYETVIGKPVDPISMDTLLRDGIDTYDFTLSHTEAGQTRNLRVVGADILTEEEQRINNVALKVVTTDLRIFEEDGTINYQTRGTQYISPELRRWFLGTDSVLGDDGSVTNYDSSPVEILFPGEPGFDDITPHYGCAAAPEHGVETVPLPVGPGVNTNK